MLCNDMAHPLRRARVRVRVRVRVKVGDKSRPIGLTSSRSSSYAYIYPINSFVTLYYEVRAKVKVSVMFN